MPFIFWVVYQFISKSFFPLNENRWNDSKAVVVRVVWFVHVQITSFSYRWSATYTFSLSVPTGCIVDIPGILYFRKAVHVVFSTCLTQPQLESKCFLPNENRIMIIFCQHYRQVRYHGFTDYSKMLIKLVCIFMRVTQQAFF